MISIISIISFSISLIIRCMISHIIIIIIIIIGVVPCGAVRCPVVWCRAASRGVVWRGVVWSGMRRWGVVLHDIEWNGMAWLGVTWHDILWVKMIAHSLTTGWCCILELNTVEVVMPRLFSWRCGVVHRIKSYHVQRTVSKHSVCAACWAIVAWLWRVQMIMLHVHNHPFDIEPLLSSSRVNVRCVDFHVCEIASIVTAAAIPQIQIRSEIEALAIRIRMCAETRRRCGPGRMRDDRVGQAAGQDVNNINM